MSRDHRETAGAPSVKLAPYQSVESRDEHPITAELRAAILITDAQRPRSTQVAIGPSELGHPCTRRLAYKLMDHPRINTIQTTTWGAIIGTSVHATLADAFTDANTRLGRIRYLVEQSVEIRPGLRGTCDLYDFDRACPIDHKVVPLPTLRQYRLTGPGTTYRVQAHAYGTGIRRLGLPVETVGVAFYPRASDLAQLYVWTEPYNPDLVTEALQRHDTTIDLACELDVEHYPEHYSLIPKTANRLCMYCPFFKVGPDTGTTCPGNTETGELQWN